ncbi:hypothetical protein Pcinc_023687, partial [Petrolisthes cinctipes]
MNVSWWDVYNGGLTRSVVAVDYDDRDWNTATPMVRPERYEIMFDAPGGVYFSNQTVSGNVVLQVTQPVNLK